MAAKYSVSKELKVMASNGYENGTLTGDDAYVLYNRLGRANHISLKVTTSNNWDKFGFSFVRGTDSKKYYTMVVNPENEWNRKVNFEEEGEEGKHFIDGADGYWFARPDDNVYNVDIYTDNSVVVMYINDVCAYTQRIYGIQKNCWSINNYGGSITVSDVVVTQY
jgi:beta-fructofuranosidase